MSEIKCYGIFQGFVKGLNDPEKRGRIKCTIPEVLDESISGWCEPCVPVAYDGGGDFCLPPLGEAVWIMFIDGDINRPVYLGGWWSENETPLKEKYNSKNIRIISYGNSVIKMMKDKLEIRNNDTDVLEISNGKITVLGDLIVNGTVTQLGGD